MQEEPVTFIYSRAAESIEFYGTTCEDTWKCFIVVLEDFLETGWGRYTMAEKGFIATYPIHTDLMA